MHEEQASEPRGDRKADRREGHLAAGATLDRREARKFLALAERWWDPEGPFRPLHAITPRRLEYLRDQVCRHFGRPAGEIRPLEGLRILDVGCGGGLASEPLARLGARVTGIDPVEETLAAARAHAEAGGLQIDYRAELLEEVAAAGERFDVVLALEVIEHVADRGAFFDALADVVEPDGLAIFSTLNRTPKSFLLGIVAAEYLLGWLPRGSHSWRRFLHPSELAGALRRRGLKLIDVTGLVHEPLTGSWRLDRRDTSINYFLSAAKPADG